jgi:hypothetical protein
MINHRLSLTQFAAELAQWFDIYAQANQEYFALEETISARTITPGFLTKNDVINIVKWGGNPHGLSGVVRRHNTDSHVETATGEAIRMLNDPRLALGRLLGKYGGIHGLGLAFATKTLRCLCPQNYGALDSKLRQCIDDSLLPNIGNEIDLYLHFLAFLRELKQMASPYGPSRRPNREWFVADIEMALFQFAWCPDHKLVRS